MNARAEALGEPTVSAGSPASRPGSARTRVFTFAGLLLVALNMRPALASVGPVLGRIGDTFGLSQGALGLLTALPVLCFGLLAPLAPAASRRFGTERTLVVALATLLLGIVLRSGPTLATLLGGTVLIGAGVAMMNVLAPALVKRDFGNHAGLVTGCYTTALNVSAAVAAGASAPIVLAASDSWRRGLIVWAALAVPALGLWLALAAGRAHAPELTHTGSARPLLTHPRTWQVVGFTAVQSVIYYSLLAWLPSIYESYGYTATHAGLILSVMTLVSAPVALVLPSLAARSESQRGHVIVIGAAALLGLLGLTVAPLAAPILWAGLLGLGLGGAFPLALTMFVLRTRHATETANLSMLAQGIAYVAACVGPIALGSLHDLTGRWLPGLALLLACAAGELLFGLGAARAGHIIPSTPR